MVSSLFGGPLVPAAAEESPQAPGDALSRPVAQPTRPANSVVVLILVLVITVVVAIKEVNQLLERQDDESVVRKPNGAELVTVMIQGSTSKSLFQSRSSTTLSHYVTD